MSSREVAWRLSVATAMAAVVPAVEEFKAGRERVGGRRVATCEEGPLTHTLHSSKMCDCGRLRNREELTRGGV